MPSLLLTSLSSVGCEQTFDPITSSESNWVRVTAGPDWLYLSSIDENLVTLAEGNVQCTRFR